MTETKSLDLSALEADYDIVGEVSRGGDARTFTATRKDPGTKRRDDDSAVLISIVTTPEGDEGNALSHLAADTKLLAGLIHRRLVPVIDGRWLGDDAFAVVTKRVADESLAEKLAINEEFSNPRIAAILREVNGLLEWAREHNVVHRTVSADRIYLEPKTDRVRVTFGVSPIPRIQQVDAETQDARTIVRIAMAMLIGVDDPKVYEAECLTDLRKDLPIRLCEETTTLLDPKKTHTAADVASYIALIGMADPLFVGEEEEKRIRADIHEEQRVERQNLATERAAFEAMMQQERAAFEGQMQEERATFERNSAEQRDAFERAMVEERAKLAKEKADLERAFAEERAKLQRAATEERAALASQREFLEKAVATERKEMERVAAEDRRQVEALKAELKHAGELEIERKRETALEDVTDDESALDDEAFVPAAFVPPMITQLPELTFTDDPALMSRDEVDFDQPPEVVVEPEVREEPKAVVAGPSPFDKKWVKPAALAGVLILMGATAVALASRRSPQPAPTVAAARAAPIAPQRQRPASIVPLPQAGAVLDSSAGIIARALDSTKAAAAPKPKPKRVARDTSARRDSVVRDTAAFNESAAFLPGVRKLPADTLRKRDAAGRDSAARRDTVVRRDSVRPDTVPRPGESP